MSTDEMMQPTPSYQPATPQLLPPAAETSGTGKSIALWGGGTGGMIVLLSLMGQQYLGVAIGAVIAIGSVVGGMRMQEREEARRHRQALDIMLHHPEVLVTQITAASDLDLERLRGMIKKQHIELTESRSVRADLVRLSQSLTSLQLAAWEKSEKDPSFRQVFEQVSGMVTTTQDGVDQLLMDMSNTSMTKEEQDQRFEAVSKLFLELLDKFIKKL